jgi:hypothetical protein
MSYTSSTTTYGLRKYVPTYQPKSDYLPGTVHSGSNATTDDYVIMGLCSCGVTRRRREGEESQHSGLLVSTPTGTSHMLLMNRFSRIGHSTKTASAELPEGDLFELYIFIPFLSYLSIPPLSQIPSDVFSEMLPILFDLSQ